MNENYVFDNFIVTENNRVAKTVGSITAKYPGTGYNPLFIYGEKGSGKTYLLNAIGNYILKNNNMRVLFVTSTDFIIDSAEDNFEDKYINVDVLIIDNIHLIDNNEKVQQSLLYIFNELFTHNKQIILSSEYSIEELHGFDERLKSLLKWGFPVEINE